MKCCSEIELIDRRYCIQYWECERCQLWGTDDEFSKGTATCDECLDNAKEN